ncbi:hypothetical protein L596_001877 [Steinernema carpocapsae]|uniref:Uncharacterized protein n=1 Tax=Steinernema carpocapsae TaxID=34508 RepID=A0A4U8UNJ7_STECR|nr:hypothetical protein L596_001877 [Steinernema carpocapsae]
MPFHVDLAISLETEMVQISDILEKDSVKKGTLRELLFECFRFKDFLVRPQIFQSGLEFCALCSGCVK